MAASLKGNAKIVVPENAKPGDEIEVTGVTFEADQADYERALRDRLSQQKRQHETDTASLVKQLEDLKGLAPKPDEQLKLQVERLTSQLSNSQLQTRIDGQLKKANMLDLPDAYRSTINLKPDASDEELVAEVEKAGEAFNSLKASLGGQAQAPTPVNFGNTETGGSRDQKSKNEALRDKVKRTRPDLAKHLDGISPEQQTEVMTSWDSQGILVTPTKK